MNVRPGTTGTYVSSNGYEKAAMVVATHDSVDPDGVVMRPSEGHVHIVIYAFTADPMHPWVARPDVPLRETAEAIPDYTIEGKLVGFFEAAPVQVTA